MENAQATIDARKNHRNRGCKLVKRRLKLAHRRRSGQHPSNLLIGVAPRNRGWKVITRLKLASPPHHIPRDSALSTEAREQKLISTPPLMQLMKYEVPVVLILLPLKYQAKTKSIFRENPAPMWCFIAATFAYWLIVGAIKQMPTINDKRTFHTLLSNAALASGVLSLISLVSIFLPYPVSLLPVAVLISSLVALALLYAFTLFLRGIECVVNKIHGVFIWARGGCNLTEEASLPV